MYQSEDKSLAYSDAIHVKQDDLQNTLIRSHHTRIVYQAEEKLQRGMGDLEAMTTKGSDDILEIVVPGMAVDGNNITAVFTQYSVCCDNIQCSNFLTDIRKCSLSYLLNTTSSVSAQLTNA